jgi:hypothetical protein
VRRAVRDFIADAEQEGLVVVSHAIGKHAKFVVRNRFGIETTIVESVSASDWRAGKNRRSLLRRFSACETPTGQHDPRRAK